MLIVTIVTCSFQIILLSNYSLLIVSALAYIILLKTTCHFLLLLVGFDTLTYQKELQLIPYTCGSSRLFSGAIFGEWSVFGKWNLVRKHLYSVLKFIVTCYYVKQSFEGFVRGIFTLYGTTISYPSTYCAYWKYWIFSIGAVGWGVAKFGFGRGEDTPNKPLKGMFSIVTSDNKFQHTI